MSIEQDARDEAEKRYPVIPDAPFGDSASVSVKRKAFVAGYIAGASRPVTDAEMEAAVKAVLENFHAPDKLHSSWWLNPERVACAVIEAARAAELRESAK